MTTQYPGFQNTVHDAQHSFRTLLDAMARPGQIYHIGAALKPPVGMMAGSAAACLALLDLDTSIWMQSGWHESVRSWLLFHTGCRFVNDPAIADFALIHTWGTAPPLADFHLGMPEEPERSTTLLMQLDQIEGSTSKLLSGPGVPSTRLISPQLSKSFWTEWRSNRQIYPLGVDVFLIHRHAVMGLPRSVLASDCED